jgi:hypothetical protein
LLFLRGGEEERLKGNPHARPACFPRRLSDC